MCLHVCISVQGTLDRDGDADGIDPQGEEDLVQIHSSAFSARLSEFGSDCLSDTFSQI